MRNRKGKGVGLFGEDGLLRVHDPGLGDSVSVRVRVVTKPSSWVRAVASSMLLGSVSGKEWVACGGGVVMNKTNEDNEGCPNGIDVSNNGNGTNKINFFCQRRFWRQSLLSIA